MRNTFRIERDEDSSEVIEKFKLALVFYGVHVHVNYGEDTGEVVITNRPEAEFKMEEETK